MVREALFKTIAIDVKTMQKGRKIRLNSKYKTAGALELISSVRGLVYGKSLVRDIQGRGILAPGLIILTDGRPGLSDIKGGG